VDDDDLWTDEDDEQLLAELEQERRAAAALVHETFPGLTHDDPPQPDLDRAAAALREGITSGGWPYDRLNRVTGWRVVPPDQGMDPERQWIFAAMCSLEPAEDPGDVDIEVESAVATFISEDWVTIVAGLVAQGPGADASPEAMLRILQEEDLVDPGDESLILLAAEVVCVDWQALGAVDDRRRLTALGTWGLPQALHDLWCSGSGEDDAMVVLLKGARGDWEARGDEWTDEEWSSVARLLVEIAPAPLSLDLSTDRAWQPFLRAVHEQVASADAAYLLAVIAECHDDVVRQQSWLDRALTADPRHEYALLSAAALASCRGDAAAALDHLRRAEVTADDDEVALLRRFTQPPAGGPSRNAPCACGSGKKFKLCCGASGLAHPLTDRASWLLSKTVEYAHSLPHRDVILARAQQQSRYNDDPIALLRALRSDPLVVDAALFADGLLDRFLGARGSLLPVDERELADEWRASRLGVYEVLSTRPGSSVLLRGADGDVEVQERTASRSLRRGDLLLARLLPTGSGWMLSTVLGLPRTARDRFTSAGDREELYELVAELHRPPQLTNTDGQALVPLEQQWSLSEEGWQRLVTQLEPTDDADSWLLMRATRHIAASVQRTPDGVVVEVNSRERAAEVASLVRQADASAELVEEREPKQSPHAAPAPMEMTPEIEAALREHLENYEHEWCDMSIPALDGRTPRDAVRTAEGRAAVEDLLSDMPEMPNGMSAKRLRALLELPTPLR
jgi:hypothetical protein